MIQAIFTDIEKVIYNNLKNAKSEINIAVSWITNPKIFKLLASLADRNILITLIVVNDEINFVIAKELFESIIVKKIQVRITNYPNLMHHKFCIIDNKILITGSYNWTKSAEKNNYENILLITEKLVINQYISEYDKLIINSKIIQSIENSRLDNYDYSKIEKLEHNIVFDDQEALDDNLEDILEENSLSDDINNSIDNAEILFLKGKYDEAIDLCNKLLLENELADAYEIIGKCKWRQGKFREQVKFAEEAIKINNEFYSAYNILGIGYSHKKNAQKSIDNYAICIAAEPDEYVYYHNRALSYIKLSEDTKVPEKLRKQFIIKANQDLQTTIKLTDEQEDNKSDYKLYYLRGLSKLLLNNKLEAKQDLIKAKDIYLLTTSNERDVFEYKDIKQNLSFLGIK